VTEELKAVDQFLLSPSRNDATYSNADDEARISLASLREELATIPKRRRFQEADPIVGTLLPERLFRM